MVVRRIVANLQGADPAALADWYAALFGLEVLMDHGWIVTIGTTRAAPVQLSFASEGGSGTPVPDLSIEVEDVAATHAKARELALDVRYPLTSEPWGVRRFYVRDPMGRLPNILSHAD